MADRILYNAGDRLKESIKFTSRNSKEDFKQYNWLAYYQVDAPAQSFFTLPDEVKIAASEQGPALRLPVNIFADMAAKHGHKGIVAVDPERATPVEDNEPFAATKEEAKEKAERLWIEHLDKTIQDHLELCYANRAIGAAPKPASHFTKRAFKLRQMTDPGAMTFSSAQADVNAMKADAAEKKASDVAAEKDKQIADLQEQLAQVLRGQKLEKIKADAEAKAAKEAERAAKLAANAKEE